MKIKDSLISLILAYFPKEKFKSWIKAKHYSNRTTYECPSASISDRIPSIQILESSKLLYPTSMGGRGRVPHIEIAFKLISPIPNNSKWKAILAFYGKDLEPLPKLMNLEPNKNLKML
mgnify:CR=1 FL=1